MKIIIVSERHNALSSAPPFTLELPLRRLLMGLAGTALLVFFAVHLTARSVAADWLEENTPQAQALADKLEARLSAENRLRQEAGMQAAKEQFAELRAGLAELRARGAMLASRVGFNEKEFFAAEENCNEPPADDTGQNAGPDAPQNGVPKTELAAVGKEFSTIKKYYKVMLQHGAEAAVTYDTVPLARPLRGANWLTSRFGTRRDPLTGRRAFHAGYDYAARRGSPVLAGASGIVDYAGRLGNYGKAVRISHGEGISTLYGHLHAFSVKSGDYVRRGEVIGKVGNTGRSTGSHLHYEVRINNRPRPVHGAIKKIRKARALPPQWAF
ncbi:MAG: M23 family metallopeptidase [Gammaproteobacteria bacterium]